MVRLALMCKSKNFRLGAVCPDSDEYRTGQWVIGKKRRAELVGHQVILTESQKSSAYMGGTIIGFDELSNGKYEVVFREDKSIVGNEVSIGHSGWGLKRSVCYV